MTDPVRFLRGLFACAVAAADPGQCLAQHLSGLDPGPLIVLGAGKAATQMAAAIEAAWPYRVSGLVVTRHGHARTCRSVRVLQAGHPMTDEASLAAAKALIAAARDVPEDAQVVFVISGGGSALIGLPLAPMSMADYIRMQTALLASGAPIEEINCLRRHVLALAGGRLALACRARRQLTLILSDVPGDAPHTIASGPTVPDPTRCAEALAVARRWRIPLPDAVAVALQRGEMETAKPHDARFAACHHRIIASGMTALEPAARAARAAGIAAYILGDSIQGEARHVAMAFAAMARHAATTGQSFVPPCVLLSGGELSVTVHNPDGSGGRNSAFLLALAIGLAGADGIFALAADTDGIDGVGAAAGAVVLPDTLARAEACGLEPRQMLDDDRSGAFFARLGDDVITGPTGTNVNDFRAILLV